jgi:hypothetical protein
MVVNKGIIVKTIPSESLKVTECLNGLYADNATLQLL